MLRIVMMLLALVICASTAAGVPEKPRLRLIGVADGLPSSSIMGLAVDRAGYLWIATTDGLARYDGVGMRVWRHVPDEPRSLPGNYVTLVHVDAQDRVWVAIEGRGLSVLDTDLGGFRHYRQSDDPRIGGDDVWAIASHGDELWFGTFGGGLHRMGGMTADGDRPITRFMPEDADEHSMPASTVLSLEFDARGTLWVGTVSGLAQWDGERFERMALPEGDPGQLIFSVSPDGDAIWVGAASGLYRRGANGRWTRPSWSAMFGEPNSVFDVMPGHGGQHWVASAHNLWRVGPGVVPTPVPVGARGPSLPMYQLLRQANGAMWFPVSGVGLGYLRPDWRRLAQLSRAGDGLQAELYRAVATAASGGVWLVGNRGELDLLAPDGTSQPAGPLVQAQMEGRKPVSIVEDPQGRIWIGLTRALVRVDRGGEVLEWLPGQPDAPLLGQLDLMRIAPDGSLWLSSAGHGVQQRDSHTGAVLATIPAGPDHGLGVGDLETMDFDAAGALWIAGMDGLARLDAETGRFAPVPGIVTGDRVFGFAFDGIDSLWLQRLAGLERYELRGERWVLVDQVGAAEGVPSVQGSGLLLDRNGMVWLSSLRGLFRWNPQTRHLRRFGLPDGLSSQEFVDRTLVLTDDGVLVSALADGGVVLLDTSAPDHSALQPSLLWDQAEVRRDGAWATLDTASELTLAPQDRELRVQLRLLAFDDVQANRYFTRLDGYDREWVAQGASGERVFAGLAPGRYTLHARAVDAAGNAATGSSLRFRVQPPWWRTSWALAGLIAAALGLLAWTAMAYRDRLKRRHAWHLAEHEREVTREASLAKTRFLATLGHEVRTPMTGVMGMSELLLGTSLDQRQRGYTESIRGAGEHLLRLVNDALDLARIESGKLELSVQPFDLRKLVAEVTALMAPLARQRMLEFSVEVADTAPHGVVGDCVRVRQILLNLLGNAIKFTEHGQVTLRIAGWQARADNPSGPGGGVILEVADTGPGLNEEQRSRLFRRFEQAEGNRTAERYGGSGLGLAICQELALAMDGRIEVDSVPGAGARFRVMLPLPGVELPAATASPRSAAAATATLALLLVEDDPTVAAVLAGLLQAQGHRVTHAAHGLAAMAEVATATFDAALLDLDLPGIDGFALARQLRAQGFTQPLIAITARADADAEPDAMAAGFDGFVRKPVTGAMLAKLLDACVGSVA